MGGRLANRLHSAPLAKVGILSPCVSGCSLLKEDHITGYTHLSTHYIFIAREIVALLDIRSLKHTDHERGGGRGGGGG